MTKRTAKRIPPTNEWPSEFEAAIRAQGEELDRFRASDEGRGLIRAIETIGQEAADAEAMRRDAERDARQSEHKRKQAQEEAARAHARANASDARADVMAQMFAALQTRDGVRTDEAATFESLPQSADTTSGGVGLPSGVMLNLFSEFMNGRKAMADALQKAAWPRPARLTLPGRGRGRDATWNPCRLAELILEQLERRFGPDAALKTKREMKRLFQGDQRLRAWRDEWEATATRSEWLGLDTPSRGTESKNRG